LKQKLSQNTSEKFWQQQRQLLDRVRLFVFILSVTQIWLQVATDGLKLSETMLFQMKRSCHKHLLSKSL